jgi:hypothetical protein
MLRRALLETMKQRGEPEKGPELVQEGTNSDEATRDASPGG